MNKKCVELLKQVIKNNYKNVRLDKTIINKDDFYYEFQSDNQVCENDFIKIENEMIQRIVGKSFKSNEELEEYEKVLEEAKERDHRKIGQDLDLFCFSDYVSAGLPLFTPRETIIIDELKKRWKEYEKNYGFEKVSCPSLADISLFETSGHAAKFDDELFRVNLKKGHNFVLKPVQCPHHTQLYASKLRSYRDLPIRYMESDKQYRAELKGAVGNSLSRVYAITVEDGHVFCTRKQVKQEIINICNLIKDFYQSMNLWDNHWVSLSVRDDIFVSVE